MEQSSVIFIIPAYNEINSISNVVHDLKMFGDVLVVDDFSNDNTSLAAINAGAFVIRNDSNRGYTNSLSVGFEYALNKNYSFAVTFDADGELSPLYAPIFCEKLKSGYDFVLGVRSHFPRFSEFLGSMLFRLLYKFEDPFCGLKGYNLKWLIRRGMFDQNNCIGIELALYGFKNYAAIYQLPIEIAPRIGQTRFGNGVRTNLVLIRALFLSIFFV